MRIVNKSNYISRKIFSIIKHCKIYTNILTDSFIGRIKLPLTQGKEEEWEQKLTYRKTICTLNCKIWQRPFLLFSTKNITDNDIPGISNYIKVMEKVLSGFAMLIGVLFPIFCLCNWKFFKKSIQYTKNVVTSIDGRSVDKKKSERDQSIGHSVK